MALEDLPSPLLCSIAPEDTLQSWFAQRSGLLTHLRKLEYVLEVHPLFRSLSDDQTEHELVCICLHSLSNLSDLLLRLGSQLPLWTSETRLMFRQTQELLNPCRFGTASPRDLAVLVKAIEDDALCKIEDLLSFNRKWKSLWIIAALAEISGGRRVSALNSSKSAGLIVASFLDCNLDVIRFAGVCKNLAACAASQVPAVLRRAREEEEKEEDLTQVSIFATGALCHGTISEDVFDFIRLFKNISPAGKKLGIRSEPRFDSDLVSDHQGYPRFIEVGEVFAVSEVFESDAESQCSRWTRINDGTCIDCGQSDAGSRCLKLAGNDGWVFIRNSRGQVVAKELPLERLQKSLCAAEVKCLELPHRPHWWIDLCSRINQFTAQHDPCARNLHVEVSDVNGICIATLVPETLSDFALDCFQVLDASGSYSDSDSDSDDDTHGESGEENSLPIKWISFKEKVDAHALKVGQVVQISSDPHRCSARLKNRDRRTELHSLRREYLGRTGRITRFCGSTVLVDVDTIGPLWLGIYGVHAIEDLTSSIFPLQFKFMPDSQLTRSIVAAGFWQVKVRQVKVAHQFPTPERTALARVPVVPRRNGLFWLWRPLSRSVRRNFGRRVRFEVEDAP